jgi:hypothetical protein
LLIFQQNPSPARRCRLFIFRLVLVLIIFLIILPINFLLLLLCFGRSRKVAVRVLASPIGLQLGAPTEFRLSLFFQARGDRSGFGSVALTLSFASEPLLGLQLVMKKTMRTNTQAINQNKKQM